MGWLRNLFHPSPEEMPENLPALPEDFTRSAKQYPAQLLDYRPRDGKGDVRTRLKTVPTVRLNWVQDRSAFTISGRRDEFREAAWFLLCKREEMRSLDHDAKRRKLCL